MAVFSVILLFVVAAFFSTSPSRSGVEAVSSSHWTERLESELTTAFEEFQTEKLLPLKDSLKEKAQKSFDWTKATSDPEVNMGPKEMIMRWDYPAEEYDVSRW